MIDDPFRALADAMPQLVWTAGPDGVNDYLNEGWFTYTGMTRAAAAGHGWTRILHPDDGDATAAAWTQCVATGEPFEVEYRLQGADGLYRWFLGRAKAKRSDVGAIVRWFGTCTDIDRQKRVEASFRFLVNVNDRISASLDVDAILGAMSEAAVPALSDWCTVLLKDERDRLQPAIVRHRDPAKMAVVHAMYAAYPADGDQPMRDIITNGTPLFLEHVDDAMLIEGARDEAHLTILRSLDIRSAMVIPLDAGGTAFGAVLLASSESNRVFGEAEFTVARLFAKRAAAALDNAMAFARERRVATTFQHAALPASLPNIPGLTFDGYYAPGRAEALIGGDWFDAVRLLDGRILISIGDVAGSGLEAAVIMAKTRQIMRGVAYVNAEPTMILDAADKALRTENPDRFVTAFVGVFDPISLMLTYASAGHNPPLVRRADGTLIELSEHDGLPLGLRERETEVAATYRFAPNSMLVLFTDGLIESTHDVGEGERRLHAAVLSESLVRSERPARAIHDAVLHDGSRDDVAILTITVDAHLAHADRVQTEGTFFEREFEGSDEDRARDTRRAFTAFLESRGASVQHVFSAEIVFAELLGNVVRHAPGRVTIRVDWSGAAPVLHVIDRGAGFWHVPRLPSDLLSESGRGLFLIAALTDDFHVTKLPDGGSHARAVLTISGTHRDVPIPAFDLFSDVLLDSAKSP